MKIMKQIWPWVAIIALVGVLGGAYITVTAQIQPQEDSQLLLESLARNDYQTALEILHRHGVAEDTLLAMADRLPQTPTRVSLNESFMHGTVLLPLEGRSTEVQTRIATAVAMGYGRQFWPADVLEAGWQTRYDEQLELFGEPPVGVLCQSLNDTNIIEYFKWFDRYADQLHSVVLNWTNLSNHFYHNGYDQVNRDLSGLYRLIKARKPESFVWFTVVKRDDHNDIRWMQAMNFQPDGLLIWNMRQFHSPFELTRERYVQVVGPNVPMVIGNFQGYTLPLLEKGAKLVAAEAQQDSPQRAADRAQAQTELGMIGKLAAPNLGRLEAKLQALGYRGLTANWLLVEAMQHQETPAGR